MTDSKANESVTSKTEQTTDASKKNGAKEQSSDPVDKLSDTLKENAKIVTPKEGEEEAEPNAG